MESRTFDSILRFPWLGGVGNTYPFCAPPLRFRPVHADECPWFDYLTVTGKFREHNGGPIHPPRISHHLCNTKKENQNEKSILYKNNSTLNSFSPQRNFILPAFSTPDFLTPDVSTINFSTGLKSSWLKILGYKSLGLKSSFGPWGWKVHGWKGNSK